MALGAENNTAGKEFHATSLLVKGQPQSFVGKWATALCYNELYNSMVKFVQCLSI